MTLASILSLLKGIVPVLEPIGEQGVAQLWLTIDAEIAKMTSPDLKDICSVLSPAVKQVILIELQKIKA